MAVKISDFGISKAEDENSNTKTQKAGTTYFMAPEVIKSTKYDNKCDVYSFGIIMFQVLIQCSDKEIYPIDKLGENNIDFMLATYRDFRPIISEKFQTQQFKNYIGLQFFKLNFLF
jgi:serine/threonine protein kinase